MSFAFENALLISLSCKLVQSYTEDTNIIYFILVALVFDMLTR